MGESTGCQVSEKMKTFNKNNGSVTTAGNDDMDPEKDKDVRDENIVERSPSKEKNILPQFREKQKEPEFAIPALPALFISKKITSVTDHPAGVKQTDQDLNDNSCCSPSEEKTIAEDSNEKTENKEPWKKSSENNKLLNDLTVKRKQKHIEFPYTQPNWSGAPSSEHNKYSITVLKEGIVKTNIDISGKSAITFGRIPEACDVVVEHPTCSRFHAVLQYCVIEKDIRKLGYYIYDLGSTHGTYVNKEKVKPKVYVRVRVGYQIKFGGSSRLYIIEGPEEDQEEEIDMEEVRKLRAINKQKMNREKQGKPEAVGNNDDGASWGFREDAKEEELDLQDLMEKKKAVEVKDPKKTLKGFFEREGIVFEYEMSERGRENNVVHVAHVRLPIESSYGTELIAEGISSNKKEAVLNCATDACKIIQAYDMMQNTAKEDQHLKRQRELEANDFYDSDDDTFLDRTGTIEKKRLKRKYFAGKAEMQEAETHESLKTKLKEKAKTLQSLDEKLSRSATVSEKRDGEDSLDAFMSSMNNKLDKTSEKKIKIQIKELKEDIDQLKKLVAKTEPALPTYIIKNEKSSTEDYVASVCDSPNSTKCQKKVKNCNNSVGVANKVSTDQKVETSNTTEKESACPIKKKKRIYGPVTMPMRKKDSGENEAEFIEWLPPENQSGDGRTHLNDKLGY